MDTTQLFEELGKAEAEASRLFQAWVWFRDLGAESLAAHYAEKLQVARDEVRRTWAAYQNA